MAEKIKVLVVEPNKAPYSMEVGSDLDSLQKMVGGYIEEIAPFDNDCVLICNEEGKMLGLPLNRALIDEDGEIYDIVAGTFLVAYAPMDSEDFCSLPTELEHWAFNQFQFPQMFMNINNKFVALPILEEESEEF